MRSTEDTEIRRKLNARSIRASEWSISLDAYDAVFCVGDIHGDLRALLRMLKLTGQVAYSREVSKKIELCPRSYKLKSRLGYPLTAEEVGTIRWVGKRNAVVLLGDVLDNRRGATADMYGVCALTGTQPLILEIIYSLQLQAASRGGCLRMVLGNHDVANAIPVDGHFCESYAPQHSTYSRGSRSMATCRKNELNRVVGFSKHHQKYMRLKLRKIKAHAIARIHWSRKKGLASGSILAIHGGICDISGLASKLPPQYDLLRGHHVKNIDSINRLFSDALESQPNAIDLIRSIGPMLPTWCRPRSIAAPKEMRQYFGTSRMVVAHQVQDKGVNCTNLNLQQPTLSSSMGTEAMCFTDIGMSRAFASTRHNAQLVSFSLRDTGKAVVLHQSLIVERNDDDVA